MSVAMIETTRYLVQEMTPLVGYTQSDEITLVWFESSQSASDYANLSAVLFERADPVPKT